jgi:hypothetical protein
MNESKGFRGITSLASDISAKDIADSKKNVMNPMGNSVMNSIGNKEDIQNKKKSPLFKWALFTVVIVSLVGYYSIKSNEEIRSKNAASSDNPFLDILLSSDEPVEKNISVSNGTNNKTEKSFILIEKTLPKHGSIQYYGKKERIAPLEIKANGTDNCFLKLVDVSNNKTVMTIFIKKGNIVEKKVPLGVYRIKYAFGEKWYGYKHLFGPDTLYSQADETFDFYREGNQVMGYTITLYKVTNGNLRTSRIDPSEF